MHPPARRAATIVALVSTLAIAIGLVSCSRHTSVGNASGRTTLRIGVLPDEAHDVLERRLAPLVAYLGATLEREIELVIPESYGALGQAFHAHEVDLAWLGGVSHCLAADRSQGRPLAMRDVDVAFASAFIVSADDRRTTFDAFASGTFAFGPRLSTSGHLMPRMLLSDLGIVPERLFGDVRYSPAHDVTAQWVRDGVVEMAAISVVVLESMLRDGRLEPGRVRMLRTTPPYQNYVWTTQHDMDETLRLGLLDAFLSLDATDPRDAEVLRPLGAEFFLPASAQDYEEIRVALAAHARQLTPSDP